MNYYMPYFNMAPSAITPMIGNSTSKGLFSRLLSGINWGSILNNTQKTLGIVNQAIPMVKQISPVMKNAKTMFKVMNEFKRIDNPITTNNTTNNNLIPKQQTISEQQNEYNTIYEGGPTFFDN